MEFFYPRYYCCFHYSLAIDLLLRNSCLPYNGPTCHIKPRLGLQPYHTDLNAVSLGARSRSWRLVPCFLSRETTLSYSGCCLVRTRAGWLHSFRRYCRAWRPDDIAQHKFFGGREGLGRFIVKSGTGSCQSQQRLMSQFRTGDQTVKSKPRREFRGQSSEQLLIVNI